MRYMKSARSSGKFALHPLIHTLLKSTLPQDLEKKKAEPKTPHFLSLNQDIVPWSQDEKCALKYIICSPRELLAGFIS
jgi:hypothetical protein